MKVLVTGTAGFIGSHLTEELLKQGDRVIGVDNFDGFYSKEIKCCNILEAVGKKEKTEVLLTCKNIISETIKESLSPNFKLYYCDIRNIEELDKIFKCEQPEIVINLAGLAGVRPSIDRALEYEEVNVRGMMNILEMCRKYNIRKFIQASSSSVYGNNKKVPFNENDKVDFPISPYAGTKKSCEILSYTYHNLYKIDIFQLRFFTVYGERQRPDLAIYKFTKNIIEGKTISLYGDGSSYRDYTYVKDIVHGIINSIKYLKENTDVYEILNLGGGHIVTLKEMVEELEKALGIEAKIEYLPMQLGDVDRTEADIRKGKLLIDYTPKTEFKEGIKKFVKWYREYNEVR